MKPVSLYFHIPFCAKRCHYCHFVSTDGRLCDMDDYFLALTREVEQIYLSFGEKLSVHTVYFGGGTPSLVPIPLYEKLFSTIHSFFNLTADTEISLEANPGSVDLAYLKGLHQIGFNRISIGAQSIHPQELTLLGRVHSEKQVYSAVENSRSAGFDNLSLDLMFALPGQNLEDWMKTLERVAGLQADHLSLYELMIEEGTHLEKMIREGALKPVEQDLAADMYENTIDYLSTAGFEQYEISNWAASRKDRLMVCRHNIQYWLNQPYIGLGVAACGYIEGYRTENTADLDGYMFSFQNATPMKFPQTAGTYRMSPVPLWDEIQDTMMLGLRMTKDGISETRFREHFNREMMDVFEKEIVDLIKKDLLEWNGEGSNRSIRLTRHARAIGNQVFLQFIDLAER